MKFLHYMPIASDFYNGGTIKLINGEKEFDRDEHTFFVKYAINQKDIQEYSNVILKPKLSAREFEIWAKEYDFIILHAWSISYIQQMLISDEAAKKIIWCVWGHDLYKFSNAGLKKDIKSNIIHFLIKKIQIPFVKKVYAICYSFPYDKREIMNVYGGDIRTFHVSYDFGYNLNKVVNIAQKASKDEALKVMVGHSSYNFLNHINILERLKVYKNQNIKIFIPLNYGDMNYREKIKEYCRSYPLEVVILEEKLSKDEYVGYLSSIDIAIMDFKHQAALGNIYLLLLLAKKIYLNGEGIIYNGLKEEGISVFDSRDIGKINYDEFAEMGYKKGRGREWVMKMVDSEETILRWKHLFDYCKKNGN